MQQYWKARLGVWLALAVIALLVACAHPATPAAPTPMPTVTPSPGWTLTPYASPTATPSPLPLPSPTLAAAAGPSPTPWTYTVVKGDTLLGIALKFGITLKALQQANPGVDPQFLSVGTRLIIPVNGDNPAGLPTPTPMPVTVGQPFCAPQADGSAMCLVTVRNPGQQALESVGVWLVMADGGEQQVESLLDVLPPGKSTVLVARFLDAPPPPYRVAARVLRALPLPAESQSQRYATARVRGLQISIAGMVARVKGEVVLPKDAALKAVWVLGVAYGPQGQPVGVRRWEAPLPIDAKTPNAFDFEVYSVGPPIQRVEVQAEAHRRITTTATPPP